MSRLGDAVTAELEAADLPGDVEVVQAKESAVELKGSQDVIKVEESSDASTDPVGFRHTHESVDESVVLQIWAATRRVDGIEVRGRERLFGEPPAGLDDAPDGVGGLAGAVRDVLIARRLGAGPWDYVQPGWPRDASDMAGKNEYRADIDVSAGEHARDLP